MLSHGSEGGYELAHVLLEGLKFRYQRTIVHRLDPRVKLLLTLTLFVIALMSSNIYDEALTFTAILIPASLAKSIRRLLRLLVYSLAFSAFIFIINYIFTHSLFSSSIVTVRFLGIVASTSMFFMTTSPDEVEYVLRWFRLPRDFVFAFATSIRFVPVLMMDLTQIIDAQKSRGLELDKGGPIKRIRNLVPVLIPLVVNALVRSSELAEAMEARGYGATEKPTFMYSLKMTKVDYLAVAIILTAAALLLSLFLHVV